MSRAVISKATLDKLIRAKLASLGECRGVEPLPVTWKLRERRESNWVVPGWTGEPRRVRGCIDAMSAYLRVLGSQFDIPEEK